MSTARPGFAAGFLPTFSRALATSLGVKRAAILLVVVAAPPVIAVPARLFGPSPGDALLVLTHFLHLQFLAPVTVECEECGGKRFNPETLEAHFKGHSIADVLEMTIEDALELFGDLPKIARPLQALVDVGVGYLSLGQPSTTLSGGEAQRIKLAKQLQRQPRQHTLYLLDEPTTGLHAEDVARLLKALQRLVDGGHSVLVIEHSVDVLLAADRLIDLGPEGGDQGGCIVAQGTPEEVAESNSHTGRFMKEFMAERTQSH